MNIASPGVLGRIAASRSQTLVLALGVCLGLATVAVGKARAADELSGADKLATLYSAEFRFTQDGVPVVPIAVAQSARTVEIEAGADLRLLPEGEGGPEIRAGNAWRIHASRTRGAKLRFWVVVFRGSAREGKEAAQALALWEKRGQKARRFERGTLFAVSGEVLDRREILVGVAPQGDARAAEKKQQELATRQGLEPKGVFAELVERPGGLLHAEGRHGGARVSNEGVLWFASADPRPLRVSWTTAKGRGEGRYHGQVYVTVGRDGGLAVVNAVPANQMLAGLVPAEIFPSAPDHALRAQAVAARGELLAKVGTRHEGEPFRLCAEVHCQVYAGAAAETPRTTAAVEATRGEILFTREGRQLVDTVYSASCGGHTEHNENVWLGTSPHPPLRGHRDHAPRRDDPYADGVPESLVERYLTVPPPSYCGLARQQGGNDRFRWTVRRSAAEMDRLLGPFKIGALRAIEILGRGVSGRAHTVRVVGSAGREEIRGELRIRKAFGGLRSSLFVVDVAGGGATFRGGGFGHGVGMCQTGAIGMAEAQKSYREILGHYYRDSAIRKLW